MTDAADPPSVLAKVQRLFPAYNDRLTGNWLITRHRDVSGLLASHALEKRAARIETRGRFHSEPLARFHENNLLFADPPAHTRLRRLFMKLYPEQDGRGLRSRVREIVHDRVARITLPSVADIYHDLAHPIPVQVICELMGLSEPDDVAAMTAWTAAITRTAEPSVGDRELETASVLTARAAARLEAAIGSCPGDGSATHIGRIRRAVERGEVSMDEAISTALMAFSAGHETTAGLLGGALGLLAGDPALRTRLRGEPELIPTAVQEMLRLLSPIQYVEYSTARDCTVGRRTIPTGQRVALLFSAANRDPRAFDRPDELDLERESSHLAFGLGRHRCPGAQLATIEAEETLSALLGSMEFTLAGTGLEWSDTQFIHRPTRLICRMEQLPTR